MQQNWHVKLVLQLLVSRMRQDGMGWSSLLEKQTVKNILGNKFSKIMVIVVL